MLRMLPLAMLASASPSPGDGSGAAPPIYVASEAVAGGVKFQVIAAPRARFEGSFSLEVTGGGNQSRHQGTANLEAGQRAILSTVTLGLTGKTEWRAKLQVQPAGASAYEQVLTPS
jgi:hypothetical protein